jgi:hypothetical protein
MTDIYEHMETMTKLCSRCNETKSLKDDFSFNKKQNKYASACKSCMSTNTQKWLGNLEKTNPLESTFYKMLMSSRSNAKSHNIPFALSLSLLRSLYAKQQGKCHYTNIPMTLRSKDHLNRDPFLISLDRINPDEGYTPTNTVLCCWSINALKGWHSEATLYTTLKTLYDNAHTLGKC